MEKQFLKDEIPMANRHTQKKVSGLLDIWEMQIKTTISFASPQLKWLSYKNQKIANSGK